MQTTKSNTNLSSRMAKAMGRVAAVAAIETKAELREAAAQMKAVKAGFEVYLTRAPLAERRALLETIAQMVGERPAARIRDFAETMQEWTPPAPAAETPVETGKVDAPAKPAKGDDKAA